MAEVSTVIGNLMVFGVGDGSPATANNGNAVAFRDLVRGPSLHQCHSSYSGNQEKSDHSDDLEVKALDSRLRGDDTTSSDGAVVEESEYLRGSNALHPAQDVVHEDGNSGECISADNVAMLSLHQMQESNNNHMCHLREGGDLGANDNLSVCSDVKVLDPHLRGDGTMVEVVAPQVSLQHAEGSTTVHNLVSETGVAPENLEQQDDGVIEQEAVAVPMHAQVSVIPTTIVAAPQETYVTHDTTHIAQQVQGSGIDIPSAPMPVDNAPEIIASNVDVILSAALQPNALALRAHEKSATVSVVDYGDQNDLKFTMQAGVINVPATSNTQSDFGTDTQDFRSAPDQNLFDADSLLKTELPLQQSTNAFGANVTMFDTTTSTSVYDIPRDSKLSPLEQISVVLKQHVAKDGDSRITINLHPSELGSVDVDITISGGLIKKIEFSASRDTLAILTKDSGILEQALRAVTKGDDASLSFNLKDGDPNQNAQKKHATYSSVQFSLDDSITAPSVYTPYALYSGGLLCVMA